MKPAVFPKKKTLWRDDRYTCVRVREACQRTWRKKSNNKTDNVVDVAHWLEGTKANETWIKVSGNGHPTDATAANTHDKRKDHLSGSFTLGPVQSRQAPTCRAWLGKLQEWFTHDTKPKNDRYDVKWCTSETERGLNTQEASLDGKSAEKLCQLSALDNA